jgi:anionic cell wall polymer biosynthesis LytR-Cps2A-Psr (LCP) family protein
MTGNLWRRAALAALAGVVALLGAPTGSLGGDGAGLRAGIASGPVSGVPATVGVAAAGSWANAVSGAVAPAAGISYGADGRFTILLLGSDWRVHNGGERTDILLVMTIDPTTKRVAAASIPRDTVYFPLHGGGSSGTNRVNAIYELYYRKAGLAHAKVSVPGLQKLKQDVAKALGTEIDYVAMFRFKGFAKLLDKIGGVHVRIGAAIRDSYYNAPGKGRGIYFPKSSSWRLKGTPSCRPYPRKCHNGLAYARSRHGTVGNKYNSDFQRERRQQPMAVAGALKIVSNGTTALADLLAATKGRVFTDLPHTLSAATTLYNLVSGAHLAKADQAVLGPNKFATAAARDPIYTFELRRKVVRAWINAHFGS